MEKREVIRFFDEHAKTWDDEMIRNDRIVDTILDYGGVTAGMDVLDVACGTGVLFPDYKKRKVKSLIGIDISSEMVKIAEKKIESWKEAEVLLGDASEYEFGRKFDCVMIYNAFPHFIDPNALFSNLSKYLKENGRITIAHGMSREKIDAHHEGTARKISNGLMEAEKLAELLNVFVSVDVILSDEEKYIISGKKC